MENIDRRSALSLGLAVAATTAVMKPASAQTATSPGATETSHAPGVVVRTYGEERSLIPSFKTVVMRDVILQPGAKTKEDTEMMNAMICHIKESFESCRMENRSRPRRITCGHATPARRNMSSMTAMPLRSCASQT